MMEIRLIFIGKSKPSYIIEGVNAYIKKMQPFCKVSIVEIKTPSYSISFSPDEIKRMETVLFDKHVNSKDYVILLDEKGQFYNSRKFAKKIENLQSRKLITIVVGGAYGASESLKNSADEMLSLSEMTFTHQNIRVMIAEQLYRAFTIINGHKFHND